MHIYIFLYYKKPARALAEEAAQAAAAKTLAQAEEVSRRDDGTSHVFFEGKSSNYFWL